MHDNKATIHALLNTLGVHWVCHAVAEVGGALQLFELVSEMPWIPVHIE